jgi:hypothetical protein
MPPEVDTLVSIHPSTYTLSAGEMMVVEVWVENVLDLYGADVQLQFDPAAFQVLDANPAISGVQVKLRSDLLQPGLVIHREADNQAGTIWYANSQSNPDPPAIGSGALFEFGFLALKNGEFPLNITSQDLSGIGGIPIPATVQEALYTVQGYKIFLSLVRQ